MKEELKIIFELWETEREWKKLADSQFNWYGNVTFRNPNDQELIRMVDIQDKQRELKKQLRKKIGWWNYIKYLITPLTFTKSLTK